MSATRKQWKAWSSWGAVHPRYPEHLSPVREFRDEDPIRDQFGLGKWAARFPPEVRRLLVIALRSTGGSLDHPTSPVGYGTVPELVILGGLLERGFTSSRSGFIGHSVHSFIFQSKLLGGRKPGGAVADFIVFNQHRTIAVRVDSIYHNPESPFGGAAATERDLVQAARLIGEPFIDRVVDVNRREDGYPLEHGPGMLIRRDFERIMERA